MGVLAGSSLSWLFASSAQSSVICVDEYQIPERGVAVPMDDEFVHGGHPLLAPEADDVFFPTELPYVGATTATPMADPSAVSRPMTASFWRGRFDSPEPKRSAPIVGRKWPALPVEAEKLLLSHWTPEMRSAAVLSDHELRILVSAPLPHGLMQSLSQNLALLGLAVSFWDHSGVLAEYREWIMLQPGVLDVGLTTNGLAIYIRPRTSVATQEEILETLALVGVDVEFHWGPKP